MLPGGSPAGRDFCRMDCASETCFSTRAGGKETSSRLHEFRTWTTRLGASLSSSRRTSSAARVRIALTRFHLRHLRAGCPA